MSVRKPKIIAFPHPGDEHLMRNIKWECVDTTNFSKFIDSKKRIRLGKQRYDNLMQNKEGIMWWNNSLHQRKFIMCRGLYLDKESFYTNSNGKYKPNEGDLLFWGEMEYPTHYEKIDYNAVIDNGYPHYIHTPIEQRKKYIENCNSDSLYKLYGTLFDDGNIRIYEPKIGLQNTDPYVFGDAFYYSCCKQRKCNKSTKLQELECGDIIIFYSYKGCSSEFVCRVDTVFVIGKKIGKYKKNEYAAIRESISDLYFQNIILPIFYGNGSSVDNEGGFTLYKSATFESPVNGMFSYFPCKPYKENDCCGFPRYEIKNGELSNEIILKSKQGFAINSVDDETAKKIWNNLTESILADGYRLGVKAYEPELID